MWRLHSRFFRSWFVCSRFCSSFRGLCRRGFRLFIIEIQRMLLFIRFPLTLVILRHSVLKPARKPMWTFSFRIRKKTPFNFNEQSGGLSYPDLSTLPSAPEILACHLLLCSLDFEIQQRYQAIQQHHRDDDSEERLKDLNGSQSCCPRI